MKKMLLSGVVCTFTLFSSVPVFSQTTPDIQQQPQTPKPRIKKEKPLISKGTWALGGNVGVQYSKPEVNQSVNYYSQFSEQTSVRVNPSLGYFISDHIMLGAGVGYTYARNSSDYRTSSGSNAYPTISSNDNVTHTYVFTPFMRCYEMIGKSGFGFFVQGTLQGGLSYAHYSSSYQILSPSPGSTDSDEKRNGWLAGVSITPGVVYFVNPHFALDLTMGSVNYTYSKEKGNQSDYVATTQAAGLNLGLSSLTIGARYYFGG